jgi:CBS domain-containing protein
VDASAAEVTRVMATYNLVSVPVVDDAGRLVGVVTIDDVLDHVLPDDWRSQDAGGNAPAARPRSRARRTPVTTGRRTTGGTNR